MQKVSFKGETNAKARKCNLQSHLGCEGASSVMIAKDKQKTHNYFLTKGQEVSKVVDLVVKCDEQLIVLLQFSVFADCFAQ